jgi:DNA-binding SARP family transcriptional activator
MSETDVLTRADRGTTSSSTVLRVLNGFELCYRGETVDLPMSSKRVFAFIAMHGRPTLRSYVAGSLWPDASEACAGANLRSSLWRLRQAGPTLIISLGPELRLNSTVSTDLQQGVDIAHRVLEGSPIAAGDAASLLSEDVLPDWYDEWVIVARERYRQLRLHALEALCDILLDQRRMGEAVEAALCAIAGEPLRESAHRCLIRIHLAEGNRGEALRQYQLYCRLLREELDVDPSPLMEELRQQISAQ